MCVSTHLRYRGHRQQDCRSSSIASGAAGSGLQGRPHFLSCWPSQRWAQLAGQLPRCAACWVVLLWTTAIQLHPQLEPWTGLITAHRKHSMNEALCITTHISYQYNANVDLNAVYTTVQKFGVSKICIFSWSIYLSIFKCTIYILWSKPTIAVLEVTPRLNTIFVWNKCPETVKLTK